jgi:hypothetical protein
MATSVILPADLPKTKNIKTSDYAKVIRIDEDKRIVRINDILPFRVKFTTIKVEGSSSSLVPPIPLQIIGFSNYIL